MMPIVYVACLILIVLVFGIHFFLTRYSKEPNVGGNPVFVKFQKTYFIAYFLALFGDWLQTPYLYKLYFYYGFMEEQIAVLYCCGFASSVVFGMWTPVAADRFGRKKLCIIFTLIYTLSCFLQLSSGYGTLMLARALSGVATSLLFTAFESWYIHEHCETHDFPREWLAVTFSKANIANGLLAVTAGIVANVLVDWFYMGPIAPFMLAVPCLLASGAVVTLTWSENYGQQKVRLRESCEAGVREVVGDGRLVLLGVIQSCYESVMYIFVFMWTPVLLFSRPPLGFTFASFMLCLMLGTALQRHLAARRVPLLFTLTVTNAMSLVAMVMCVVTTYRPSANTTLTYISFLILELSTGIYLPTIGKLREMVVPQQHSKSIANIFRVPLNLIACLALMMLHNRQYWSGNRVVFVICALLLGISTFCCIRFNLFMKREHLSHLEDLNDSNDNSDKLEQTV